jgi:hypothetical protein
MSILLRNGTTGSRRTIRKTAKTGPDQHPVRSSFVFRIGRRRQQSPQKQAYFFVSICAEKTQFESGPFFGNLPRFVLYCHHRSSQLPLETAFCLGKQRFAARIAKLVFRACMQAIFRNNGWAHLAAVEKNA